MPVHTSLAIRVIHEHTRLSEGWNGRKIRTDFARATYFGWPSRVSFDFGKYQITDVEWIFFAHFSRVFTGLFVCFFVLGCLLFPSSTQAHTRARTYTVLFTLCVFLSAGLSSVCVIMCDPTTHLISNHKKKHKFHMKWSTILCLFLAVNVFACVWFQRSITMYKKKQKTPIAPQKQ